MENCCEVWPTRGCLIRSDQQYPHLETIVSLVFMRLSRLWSSISPIVDLDINFRLRWRRSCNCGAAHGGGAAAVAVHGGGSCSSAAHGGALEQSMSYSNGAAHGEGGLKELLQWDWSY